MLRQGLCKLLRELYSIFHIALFSFCCENPSLRHFFMSEKINHFRKQMQTDA